VLLEASTRSTSTHPAVASPASCLIPSAMHAACFCRRFQSNLRMWGLVLHSILLMIASAPHCEGSVRPQGGKPFHFYSTDGEGVFRQVTANSRLVPHP